MKIVMEKYHGFGNDYLIWDPVKNKMQLDSKRVKEINKSNLGLGVEGIIYGPIYQEDKIIFRMFRMNGQEIDATENSVMVFLKYIESNEYISKEASNNKALAMEVSVLNQNNDNNAHNIGFVILNNQFVEELQVIS